ncbi:MAG: biotin transporter BioY [Lachnospiraceae bacterium]
MKTKELTTCALFSALIIIGAFIKIDIPLPLYTMHFTLQWFFVIMAGLVLGEKLGTLSVVVYVALGLAGLPIFAAGGGPAYVLRPGFGFLLGFIPAVYLIGRIANKTGRQGFITMLVASTVGMVVYYSIGAIYFFLIKNFYVAEPVSLTVVIVQYCLITVFPDFLLCILASLICKRIRSLMNQRS